LFKVRIWRVKGDEVGERQEDDLFG
jgi:hypothetical protein